VKTSIEIPMATVFEPGEVSRAQTLSAEFFRASRDQIFREDSAGLEAGTSEKRSHYEVLLTGHRLGQSNPKIRSLH